MFPKSSRGAGSFRIPQRAVRWSVVADRQVSPGDPAIRSGVVAAATRAIADQSPSSDHEEPVRPLTFPAS